MNERLAALDFIKCALRNDGRTEAIAALRAEIHAGHTPWEAVVSLANKHLLTPALWVALNDKGLAADLPEDLRHYLQELHQLSRERNRHLRIQLLEAVRQLNTAGIVPLLLKGAKHLVTAIYSDPGIRIMTDIDLLLSPAEIPSSLNALQQLGYESIEDVHGDYHEGYHHCAPLFRPGDYGTLEIHRGPTENRYAAILPLETALAEAELLEVEGCRMKVLSPTYRILHNIVHSQLVDMHHVNGIVPLRSMHEVAIEDSNSGSVVDWETIQSRLTYSNRLKELRAYTYMAHQLFGVDFPVNKKRTPAARLYYQRCRLQMRWRWADRWGHRLGRYSADMLQKRTGCGSNWAAINLARFQQLKERASHFITD